MMMRTFVFFFLVPTVIMMMTHDDADLFVSLDTRDLEQADLIELVANATLRYVKHTRYSSTFGYFNISKFNYLSGVLNRSVACNLLSYFRRSPSPRGFGGMATSSPLGDHDTLTPPNSKCATPTRSLSPSSPLLDSTFSILGDPDSIVTQITLINGEKILVREELSSTSTSQLGSRFGSNLCSPSPWLKDRPTVSEPIEMSHGANTIGSTTRYYKMLLQIINQYTESIISALLKNRITYIFFCITVKIAILQPTA